MVQDKKKVFTELLKKRRKMSKANEEKKHNISKDDSQLIDVLKNFNESKEYKMLKNIK